MNFLSIILLLIVIVMLVVIAILIKPAYKSLRNTETNKNRKLVIISIASLVCLLFFTYTVIEIRSVDSGYHHSIGQYMISGISGIEVKKRSFDMENPVSVLFSYGHIKSNIYDEDREIMIGHKIEVFLSEYPSTGEQDKIVLYTREFDGVEFFSDDYYVGNPGLINIIFKNDYKENQTIEVDFSTIDFDGKIIVKVTELFYMQDSIDGEIVSTEFQDYSQSYLYFKIEGDKVVFSTSR